VAVPGLQPLVDSSCALATHLCIGQAYAISVFNLPLTRQLGITKSLPHDWKLTELGWIFTMPSSRSGRPRRCLVNGCNPKGLARAVSSLRYAGDSASCWARSEYRFMSCGSCTSGTACSCCGLALATYAGFHADLVVSDRRGMSTGMAIMGFGGGALIASPCLTP